MIQYNTTGWSQKGHRKWV